MEPGKIWLIFELIPGHIGKSIRPKGFESIKPTFRILSMYTKTGVSLITAGYRRLPQDIAGSPYIGVFNGIYHIITRNRHYIINNSNYLHLFCC